MECKNSDNNSAYLEKYQIYTYNKVLGAATYHTDISLSDSDINNVSIILEHIKISGHI